MFTKTKRHGAASAAIAVPAALWVLAVLGGCENPAQGPGQNTVSGGPAITRFSVAGTAADIDAAAKTIRAAVPYFDGIDPAALAVEVKAEEGASVIPVFSGVGDFSSPRTMTVRRADGSTDVYEVSVYVLFEGEEGLEQLYGYTDPEKGFHDKDNPLYIALGGLEFKRYAESINGRESAYLADHISYYLRDQYVGLDLSRCTGRSIASTGIDSLHSAFYRVVSVVFPATVRVLNPELKDSTGLFHHGALTRVEFPPGLEEIGGGTFGYCDSLKAVEFPPSLKTIGYQAFWYSGVEEVRFNQGLESIGSFSFYSTRLKTLVLPSSVRALGHAAFSYTPLESADLSAAKITVLSSGVFLFCGRLRELKLPATVKDLEGRSLVELPAIKTLDLSATSIVETSVKFQNNTSLETLIFPETLEYWQITAYEDTESSSAKNFATLYGCDSLKTLVFRSPAPPDLNINGVGLGPVFNQLPPDFAIYVPDSAVEAYRKAKNFSRYADHIKALSALRF
jgi:hypothetical protein